MSPSASPTAAVLITGDELLRGFIQDANSGFVAEQLRNLGIDLRQIRIVGDDYDDLAAAIAAVRSDLATDLVVLSGGLGPTHDDRTSEAVAAAAGVQLAIDEAALDVVESRVRAYGRMRTPEEVATFTPGNRKQATMPSGATWVEPLGTAPGYVLATGDCTYVVLPGPPSELRHAWLGVRTTEEFAAVVARVRPKHERLIRVWGVPESRASQVLAQTGHHDDDACRVTICARDGELEIAVRGSDVDAVDALVDALRTSLGDAVFVVDDHRAVADIVTDALQHRSWTIATCESCTAGLLGVALTNASGSSSWFLGGLMTYANEAKSDLAHVDAALIAEHGAVSEPVARAMAAGARTALGADVGVGITGIAGPGGGSEEKPVGTVHIAISTPEGDAHGKVRIPGDRATVRRRTVHIALHELREMLLGGPAAH